MLPRSASSLGKYPQSGRDAAVSAGVESVHERLAAGDRRPSPRNISKLPAAALFGDGLSVDALLGPSVDSGLRHGPPPRRTLTERTARDFILWLCVHRFGDVGRATGAGLTLGGRTENPVAAEGLATGQAPPHRGRNGDA